LILVCANNSAEAQSATLPVTEGPGTALPLVAGAPDQADPTVGEVAVPSEEIGTAGASSTDIATFGTLLNGVNWSLLPASQLRLQPDTGCIRLILVLMLIQDGC
jgi:hypothetical protein